MPTLRSLRSLIAALGVALVGLVPAGGPAGAALRPSPEATVAAPSADSDAVRAYVTQVYGDLFGRGPDPEGLATWVGKLLSGTPYGEVANAITGSNEYRSRLIRESYTRYLGRGAEPAGLDYWLGRMCVGQHIEDMQAGFIASDEFYARGGGTDAGWVSLLYRTVLGRTPAPSEVAWWVGAIGSGMNRGSVALGFLYSTEHLTTVVDGYYVDLLGRHIDPSGKASWVGLIQHGHRDEEIIAGIVASTEYRNRVVVWTTTRVGTASSGDVSYWDRALSVSEDGRWVAFDSDIRHQDDAASFVRDVFVWDRVTGETSLVSAGTYGSTADSDSYHPSISADGRWVVFVSNATDAVGCGTNSVDLFVWDRLTKTTTPLPGRAPGCPFHPAISADGQWVVYASASGVTGQIYVTDRATGATRRVSESTGGVSADGHCQHPVISADGRWVAYDSLLSNLRAADDDGGKQDVFLWDRVTGDTVLVSSAPASGPYDSFGSSAISADGRWIAYVAGVAADPARDRDVLVWDRATQGASSAVRRGGVSPDGSSQRPSISADGAWLTFDSGAENIVGHDWDRYYDVFRTNLSSGATSEITAGVNGERANSFSSLPVISGDGRWVAYTSYASNLVRGDVPGTLGIFITGPFPVDH